MVTNDKDKYYVEGEVEFICPVCGHIPGIDTTCPSCSFKFKPVTKDRLDEDAYDRVLKNRMTAGIERFIGRKISKSEITQVSDLIKYHLSEVE